MVSSSEDNTPDPFVTKRRQKRRLPRKKRLKLQREQKVPSGPAKLIARRSLSPKRLLTKSRKKSWQNIRKNNQRLDCTTTENKIKTTKESNIPKQKGLKKITAALVGTSDKDGEVDKQAKHIDKLQKKLNAAKFRYLNEKLYRETGEKSFNFFQADKESFDIYHEGFQDQVKKWPVNPLDKIITYVHQSSRSSKIVDFGCGEALLAQSVPQEVFSYDLVSLNKYVTACDMAHVPLKIASMDIAVFCLSLMGTNMAEYITEASRVLKHKGILLIGEVVSRFGKQLDFVKEIEKMGFSHSSTSSYKLFVIMKFMRDSSKPRNKSDISMSLKPCVYKKR